MLPIDRPPIDGGWVRLDAGRVVDAGGGRPPADAEDLGDVAILPGLVNAHTHLELSSLAGRVPPAASLVEWIRRLMSERDSATGGDIEIARAAERALRAAQAAGTVLFGDISNTLMSLPLLASNEAGGVVFHELVGFRAHDPGAVVSAAWENVDARGREIGLEARAHLSAGVVAHAPYSVSPQLFSAIALSQRDVPLSVHLGESAEELEFLQTGRGPFRELLEQLGAWVPGWTPPRHDPVRYLADLGYLTPGCLVVHAVHLNTSALDRLRDAGSVVVTCPRSNEWVGAGMPPISHFYASGVRVAIGTDSLASVASLNMFDELAAMRRIAPEVTASSLLESATRIGADALGHGDRYGTISPGKSAALLRVRVPAATADVEEYLVGGIKTEDIAYV